MTVHGPALADGDSGLGRQLAEWRSRQWHQQNSDFQPDHRRHHHSWMMRRSISNLVFDGSDYILSGGSLELASTSGTSTVSVATSRSAVVSTALNGSVGLLKTGSWHADAFGC